MADAHCTQSPITLEAAGWIRLELSAADDVSLNTMAEFLVRLLQKHHDIRTFAEDQTILDVANVDGTPRHALAIYFRPQRVSWAATAQSVPPPPMPR